MWETGDGRRATLVTWSTVYIQGFCQRFKTNGDLLCMRASHFCSHSKKFPLSLSSPHLTSPVLHYPTHRKNTPSSIHLPYIRTDSTPEQLIQFPATAATTSSSHRPLSLPPPPLKYSRAPSLFFILFFRYVIFHFCDRTDILNIPGWFRESAYITQSEITDCGEILPGGGTSVTSPLYK
ncbi:unnamed protein product [Tuber melanosporum]|uniref:(Perigord truffle) hypothetical protein n=1 Tax=Tuber melanosporum (strain Mel28) TaxID=656061 RepID=D5G8M8_TUBMM|nr:uncharacterized protein GSTUM_00003023001 [Tuber melanosporum]CAZ80871.1 unnamed protein product [Tuber melanosporum]